MRSIILLAAIAFLAACGGGGGGGGPTVPTYHLTCNVGPTLGGTITPTSGDYPAGTVVTLTVTPDPGFGVESWSGTDDNSLRSFTNTVTITGTGPQTVTVTFTMVGPA